MRRLHQSVGLIVLGGTLAIGITILIMFGVLGTPRAHSVALTWHAPVPVQGVAIVGYNVYRSTTHGGPYVPLARKVSGTAYKDTLVNSQRTYYYVVTAIDASGRESAYSEEIKAVIP